MTMWALFLPLLAYGASAQMYNDIQSFGDSLTDHGNLFLFCQLAVCPTPIPFPRTSNGPLTVEILAQLLNLQSVPANPLPPAPPAAGGNNYAFIGANATDADGNEATPDINLPTQVNIYLSRQGGNPVNEDDLHYVWAGANDISRAIDLIERAAGVCPDIPETKSKSKKSKKGKDAKTGKSKKAKKAKKSGKRRNLRTSGWADDSQRVLDRSKCIGCRVFADFYNQALARTTAAFMSVKAQVLKLVQAGAKKMVIGNVPNIGRAPISTLTAQNILNASVCEGDDLLAQELPTMATKLSLHFNKLLEEFMGELEDAGSLDQLVLFDSFAFVEEILDDPGRFGFSNAEDPCLRIFTSPNNQPIIDPDCGNPFGDNTFFWHDEVHPMTAASNLAANALFAELTA